MAEDVNANIRIGVDTSDAVTSVKNLQRQIALLNAQIATGSKTSAANAAKLNQQLVDGVNATGRFAASMTTIKSSTEAFTTALEKNKLSMGQYFRYSMGATRTFGRFFGKEFDTIQKVAIERTKDLQTQFISLGRNANGALQAIKVRPLSLDMNDLSTKTMIAAQKMQLMNQLMKQGSTQLLNWGKNTQWAGRQLMVGFTIPLTMFATAAAKSFMDIEKQIIKIQRVYGDFNTTVEQTKAMTDQIRSLANEYTKYGVAVTDTLNLAADAAAAGKTGQELLSQISEATRLAVLGNVEQTQALETTMSITNAFGVAAEDLAKKIDFLNAVENQSVTSIEDLTVAIPKAGPVIQQLGGDVEDLAFFLTAMKEGGINASEGANALKSGLASLINPTNKAKEMLSGFGINIEKIVQANKGDVKGIVVDFATALDTLDPLNRARAIEQLFGKFQFSRLSTLFQNVIKDGTQAQRVLELSNATTQELAILSKRELGKLEQSTTYKFEKAFADFQAAIAPVGEEFLKLITPVIEFGTKLLQQFNNLDAGVKQFVMGLVVVLGGVFPALLMTVGLFANGIANILKLVSAVSMMFKRTSGDAGILGNQFEYMTQAEIQAAAAAASLDQVHSKLRQTFTAEKAAVDALTTAYQRNIAAQKGALTGGASTRRPKPATGYANGIVSVPGPKGAGDVVPAMLSPGEAVIPAKMAKKYGGLINGMIADNIPGYKLGKKSGSNFGHFGPGESISVQDALSSTDLRLTQAVRKDLEDILKFSETAKLDIKHGWGVEMSGATNRKLTTGANIEDVQKIFTGKDIARRYGESARFAGVDINDQGLQKEIKAYDDAMQKKIADLRKAGVTAIYDTEEQVKALPKNQRKFARSLEAIDKQVAAEVGKTNKQFAAMRQNALKQVRDIRFYGAGMSESEKDALIQARREGKVSGSLVRSKGTGKGYRINMSRPASPGKPFGVMPSSTKKPSKPEQSRKALSAGTLTTTEARKVTQSIGKDGKVRYFYNGVQVDRSIGEAAVEKVAKADEKNARAREARANKPAPATPAAPKKPGIGSRIASGVRGMGGMGIGMGVSMAGGAMAMIPGLQGLGSALAMIGPLFMMLPAKIALVVGALGLLAFGVYSLSQAQEEQRKKALELADAQVMSLNSMNKMAEDMGTVSATQARETEMSAKLTSVKEEELTAGQQYIKETESGQKILEDVRKMQESGSTVREISSSVASNLANAVAQNVISKEQGNQIIAALAIESGNLGINAIAGKQFEQYTADLTKTTGMITADNLKISNDIFSQGMQKNANRSGGLDRLAQDLNEMRLAFNVFGNMGTIDTFGGADRNAVRQASTMAINTYGQAVGGTDAINAEFDRRIADAKNAEEIADLESQRAVSLESQRESANDIFDQVLKTKKALGDWDFNDNFMANIEKNFAEGSPMRITAQKVKDLAESDFKTRIQTQLQSGTLSPESVEVLLSYANRNEDFGSNYNLLISTSGEVEALNMISSLQASGTNETVIDTVIALYADNSEATAAVTTLSEAVAELNSQGANISLEIADFQDIEKLTEVTDVIELAKDLTADGPVKFEAVAETEGFKGIKADADWFNSLDAVSQRFFLTYYATVQATVDDSQIQQWLASRRGLPASLLSSGAGASITSQIAVTDADRAAFAAEQARRLTESLDLDLGGGNNNNNNGGGGGGSNEDSVLKALNEARDKQQKALNVIALKEEAINKKYDKRRKALEDIAKINSRIAEQQMGQLDIAEAIARGDTVAVARAIQAQRQKAAEYAQEEQMRALEAKRQAELDGIIVNGQTREAYEAEIARLNLKIAERELALATATTSSSGGSGGNSSGNSGRTDNGPDTDPDPPRTLLWYEKKNEYPSNKDHNAGYGMYWKWTNNRWTKAVRSKPGELGVGKKWLWNDVKDTWSQVPAGLSFASGGLVGYSMGGKVAKRYFADGGQALGSDTIPAMLTPGEFVVKRPAVQGFGVKNLEAINNGQSLSGSVYNYSVTVNASTNSSADEIARVVMSKIKQVDGARLRGNRY